MCSACCDRLERELGDVAAIVAELDVTLSKQARIANAGPVGLARERTPINVGAMTVADDLQNTLTTWARNVVGHGNYTSATWLPPSVTASWALMASIDAIRRHPAVVELFDEVTDAIAQARRAVDRPGNRTIIFVGPCPEARPEGGICDGEVYAFIPTEDDRPSRLECRTSKEHKWTAVQWLRAGKRILDRIEERKREKRGVA